LNKTRLTPIAA